MIERIAFTIPGGVEVDPGVEGVSTSGLPVLMDIITWGTTMLMIGATLLFIILIVWGGIQWITSGGEKSGIESARKRIVFAIVGLVIIFLSFAIIQTVGKFFNLSLL